MTMPVLHDDEGLGDRVFRYRVEGASERACAKRFGITVQDVHKLVMERAPSIDHEARALEVALELERLNAMAQRFYGWVMETDEPNVACAAASILIRLSERKGSLLGLDHAPMRRDQVTLLDQTPKSVNSTEKIRQVIARVVAERPQLPPANGADESPPA